MIDGLTPPELAAGGLAGSVQAYALLAARTYGAQVVVHASDLPALDPHRETAVYRIAQESIGNALRHSGGRQVTVTPEPPAAQRSCSRSATTGRGFDPRTPQPGLGLASMREQAGCRSAGSLVITSAPGEGTKTPAERPGVAPPGSLSRRRSV